MEKTKVLEIIVAKLEAERANLAQAALNTYEAATHEESEPEDQYDTRGLEASYLAGAQAKRVAEVEQTILVYRQIQTKYFNEEDPIGATALVELDYEGKVSHCLLLPMGAGNSV